MKNFILLLLITLNLNGFSQITLENQINTSNPDPNGEFITTDNLGIKYVIDNLRYNGSVVIYNIDHSIFSTINVDLNTIYNTSNYSPPHIFITAMSQHLFDSDDGIEFFVEIEAQELSGYDYYTISAIIDDDGSVIYTFYNMKVPPSGIETLMPSPSMIINTTNGTKMILVSDDKINIYSLPGTVSSITNTNQNSNSIFGYPNPTRNSINISYNLPQNCKNVNLFLYNSENKLIRKFNINSNSNKIKIKTNNLSSGIYYYRIVGNNYKSETKRFIRIN